jgi:hypothetical protein
MGGSSFDYSSWSSTSATYKTKSVSQTFTASKLDDSIDPSKMKGGMRESCDSDANPNSTPIIIGLDFTGSMQQIPQYMISEGLGELFKEIYDRKPVSDPQVLFAGFGDVDAGDSAPLQVGQFESQCDLLIDGLEKFWLNGCGGGGNGYETPDLVYYFASMYTKTDSMLKHGKKGFLFTISDEPPAEKLRADSIERVFGTKAERDFTFSEIINDVCKSYIPFHIVMTQGSHVRYHGVDSVVDPWKALLGEHVIICEDYTKLSEIITSILQVKAGVSKEEVVKSWSGDTSLVVATAINSLTVGSDESVVF